jgi:hypothetical protein
MQSLCGEFARKQDRSFLGPSDSLHAKTFMHLFACMPMCSHVLYTCAWQDEFCNLVRLADSMAHTGYRAHALMPQIAFLSVCICLGSPFCLCVYVSDRLFVCVYMYRIAFLCYMYVCIHVHVCVSGEKDIDVCIRFSVFVR